nr:hypothetical protein [Ramlibacter montanisoli]
MPATMRPIRWPPVVARGQELLVALAAHLRAHHVKAVARHHPQLQQEVDVAAGGEQAGEVAVAHQLLLVFAQLMGGHEGFLVALEGLAVGGVRQGVAHLVDAVAAPGLGEVEDLGSLDADTGGELGLGHVVGA